ncbi:hypothetical protein GVN21_19470 [Caulobacter sp. SLTY]|uniref:hypothetical protein n=1 Tax=Caulobacter sp. SLTY TaxID=2683262 RepID=UPI001411D36B|nr:hypothetical protein [Caulobacter sp. SLTY]NBB17547.1 hypothetical protein [Caulobacter sp. SLTY]
MAVVLLLIGLGWTAVKTRAFPGARTAPRSGGGCLLLLAVAMGLLFAAAVVFH